MGNGRRGDEEGGIPVFGLIEGGGSRRLTRERVILSDESLDLGFRA